MAFLGTIPRRCVNLPPGTLRTLAGCLYRHTVQSGPALGVFQQRMAQWLGVPYVFGTSMGRSAFQLALESLDLGRGAEIIFPALTFPVMPLIAQQLGYTPIFCAVDAETFNAGPEHITPKITPRTGAIVATHLFGQPCPIQDVVALARRHDLRVVEDCAHTCGVRVDGRQVGTFGDVGIFSFAEGKNMPCLGGGAIATADEAVARRAEALLAKAPIPATATILKIALAIWAKWLLTRPVIFGLTVYPVLRLQLCCGRALIDSTVGEELLEDYRHTKLSVSRMASLQATIGLLQLEHIDMFNTGAQRNAQLLTDALGTVPGITLPQAKDDNHIYVYYPLTVVPEKRDALRHYLLRHGVDSKLTDMCDCAALAAFCNPPVADQKPFVPNPASILEICVYPTIPVQHIRRVAQLIRTWAGMPD
jgi:dTDP-4-amino-4,6-dideoxygalactose transaminase